MQHHNSYSGVLSQYSLKDGTFIFVVSDSKIKEENEETEAGMCLVVLDESYVSGNPICSSLCSYWCNMGGED